MNPNGPQPMDGGYTTIGGAGAALGALGGFYDTYQRSRTAKRNTDKTIAAQRAEAEKAYQRQIEMWHMQNAYNSPEQQMERFGAAGLNPHLIYGQGSPGNAQSFPKYQQPNLQYKYEAPTYGGAVAGILPTLMSVGTWMQNMRLSENKIQQSDQLVHYLESKYPHEIRQFGQKESMWDYQREVQESGMYKSRAQVADILEGFRHKYGVKLDTGAPYQRWAPEGKGMRAIERAHKTEQARLTGLQADWYSPAAIMKMVGPILQRLLGGAGKRVIPRGGGAAKEIGKGQRGRWSTQKKRWVPR